MEDSLKQLVLTALPDLTAAVQDSVLQNIRDCGVEQFSDLRYIRDSDLSVLKPIQARKLLQHIKRKFSGFTITLVFWI